MRKPEVTRNISIRKFTVKCIDTRTDKVFNKHFFLYQKPKDDAGVLRLVKKVNELEYLKPVAVMGFEDVKVRAKMSVEEFLKHATIIEE